VLTYRRPEQLQALLPELRRQAVEQNPSAAIIVVDNDPSGSARPAVESLRLDGVQYVHEPQPGIAAARNAALRAASSFDALVFIDDDETPDPGWLSALLSAHGRLGGAAITGPVLRTYEQEPVAWVEAARVMDRKRLPTGTVMDAAATNNLLLSLPHVRRHGLTFDDELGLTGGSDSLFTRQIRRTGGSIYWCDEAVVREFVPRERLTGRWTLRRGYRAGNTAVTIDLKLAGAAPSRALVRVRALGGGLARVAVGGARALAGFVTRDADRTGLGAWLAARGAGHVGGALGHRYVEYRRDAHGQRLSYSAGTAGPTASGTASPTG
jgi:glycosyltransferase involved in cell wall biosynthesis